MSNEGQYICRASNSDETLESSTEAVIVSKAIIDKSKSGVVKTSSTKIVVSCQALGKPRPEVDFRLYDMDGPFMVKSGIYKFLKSTSGRYVSRVKFVLSAHDDVDVHTVFCYAGQGDGDRSFSTLHKINVFPKRKEDNWELYHRIRDTQGG